MPPKKTKKQKVSQEVVLPPGVQDISQDYVPPLLRTDLVHIWAEALELDPIFFLQHYCGCLQEHLQVPFLFDRYLFKDKDFPQWIRAAYERKERMRPVLPTLESWLTLPQPVPWKEVRAVLWLKLLDIQEVVKQANHERCRAEGQRVYAAIEELQPTAHCSLEELQTIVFDLTSCNCQLCGHVFAFPTQLVPDVGEMAIFEGKMELPDMRCWMEVQVPGFDPLMCYRDDNNVMLQPQHPVDWKGLQSQSLQSSTEEVAFIQQCIEFLKTVKLCSTKRHFKWRSDDKPCQICHKSWFGK